MQNERTTFVGVVTPPAVTKLSKLLKKAPKEAVKAIIELVVTQLESQQDEQGDDQLSQIASSTSISENTLADLYAGFLSLLGAALRLPSNFCKKQVFNDDLEFLKIPTEYIPKLTSIVFNPERKAKVVESGKVRLPTLSHLKWRVDVSISTSALNRALRPSLLMQMTLSDGSVKTFEAPVDQFHSLRYNVAYVLKEMEDLENKPVLAAP